MNIFANIVNRLEFLINEIPGSVESLPEDELSYKPSPVKWSKKEILGHLCDSAFNNHSRFVRAQFEDRPFKITPYEQDEWVELNHYREMNTGDIINLWVTLNNQVHFVVSNMTEDKLDIECDLGRAAFREGEDIKPLLWLIEDYVIHMEYHLKQIINEDWLRNEYGK